MKSKLELKNFKHDLRKALEKKDYSTANHLITTEKEKSTSIEDKINTKKIILKETYHACNRRQGFFDSTDDSLHGINNKIINANIKSGLTIDDLEYTTQDQSLNMANARTFLK